MKKVIGLWMLISACTVFVSCATTTGSSDPSTESDVPNKATIQAGGVEQQQEAVARKNEQSKGDIFVISNRNGTIKPDDCSGLGDSLDSQVKYLLVRGSSKSCAVQNEQDFIANMILQIKKSNRPLVIFIHGSGQGFKTALEKAETFSSLYDTNILSLDWPIGEKTGDYKIANRKAGDSGKAFAPVFERIMAALSSDNTIFIDTFSHSMGNYVLQKLVESSDKSVFSGVNRVIINAADVMLKDNKVWVEKLTNNTKNKVFIVSNRNDRVIKCSAGIGFRINAPICGMVVSNRIKGARLGNTIPSSNFADGATYLDVTKINNIDNKHEYYLGSPEKLRGIYKEILDGSHDPSFNNIPHIKQANNSVISFK
jgi:hypothetical protein